MDYWTNDKIILLIELYKKKECIWNPKNSNHKCRNSVHDAWTDIGKKLDTSVLKLKRKIKNLVSQFHREHKNIAKLKNLVLELKELPNGLPINIYFFKKTKIKFDIVLKEESKKK